VARRNDGRHNWDKTSDNNADLRHECFGAGECSANHGDDEHS
jgi:hypothetical protein